MTIDTPHGPIEILSPDEAIIQSLNTLLPFGLMPLKEHINGARFGMVMSKAGKEVMCLKQQSIERPKEDAEMQFQLNHYMIVETYTRFRAHQFAGGYMACPYLRQRDNGLWEPGIGHFIFPSKNGPEAHADARLNTYDPDFGVGATAMLTSFIFDMREGYKDKPFKEPPTIGLDFRPRTHLTYLAMNFMILGSQVICLRAHLREEDPAWGVLSKAGIGEVVHLPCVPIEIRA